MSLEEKVLESVRNLKAMAEQCIDLATKVADELTKEKETKKQQPGMMPLLVLAGDTKQDQFFMYKNNMYKNYGNPYDYFVADGTKRKLIQGHLQNKKDELDADIHHFDSETPVYLYLSA